MQLINQAKKAIENEPKNGCRWRAGSCCKYMQINSEWGVKVYKIRSIREYTWNLQNMAYRNIVWHKSYKTQKFNTVIIKTAPEQKDEHPPLAPKPGEWFSIDGRYAYLTQSADTDVAVEKTQIQQLRDQMEGLGLYGDSFDMEKLGNCGYLNGRPVCVDFDALSITVLTYGGILQQHIKTPEKTNGLCCDIDEEIKHILNWKSA